LGAALRLVVRAVPLTALRVVLRAVPLTPVRGVPLTVLRTISRAVLRVVLPRASMIRSRLEMAPRAPRDRELTIGPRQVLRRKPPMIHGGAPR
jgi:hypothetical protein